MSKEKVLSIFVDESGNFGIEDKNSPYYVVTMVFHDQDIDISDNIKSLNDKISKLGYDNEQAVHTGPLIRRENPYENYSSNERRAILSRLYFFLIKTDISYKTFILRKNKFDDLYNFEAQMARVISQFIRSNLDYFQSFEKVILYYDNGQHELNKILNSVLATELSSYEHRIVTPSSYRLFQVADLICTAELLNQKLEDGKSMTHSEELIFHTKRDFKKDFLKTIRRKKFGV